MFLIIQKQMIFWTAALVVALGVAIGMICLQPPTPEAEQVMSPAYSRLVRAKAKRQRTQLALVSQQKMQKTTQSSVSSTVQIPLLDERGPASLLPVTDENGVKAIDLTLDCTGPSSSKFENSVTQVRIKGQSCAAKSDIVATEIVNSSNGTSATVFLTQAHSFTSDYIPLSNGENKIRIQHAFKDGTREQREYLIERLAKKSE